jgi:hypothetical protein
MDTLLVISRLHTSRSRLHFSIPTVRQGLLTIPRPPSRPWGQRFKVILILYSTIATLLFTAWLVVPVLADTEEPKIELPWTIIKPLAEACYKYGGFEFANELYSCAPAGTLGGDLRMPPAMTIADRQIRMAAMLPRNVWGYWIQP